MDTNTVQLLEAFGNRLDSYIQVVSEKMGMAADHFYPVLINQCRLEGVVEAFGIVVLAAAAILFLRVGFNNISHREEESMSLPPRDVKAIVSFILGGISTLVCIVSCADGGAMTSAVTKILNPEYAVIKKLLEMIK